MRTIPGITVTGLLMLAACSPHLAKEPPAPRPSQVMAETFGLCQWEKVENQTLSIWSYACGKDAGNVHLVADDRVGGFAIGAVEPDGTTPRGVIRTFVKAKNAPVSAILPAVLAATGDHKASCQLVETDYGDWRKVYLLEPTGAEKAAYDKANDVEPQPNPCGDLGIGPVGDRFFKVLDGDPSRVIWYDMGSEIQIFDISTLAPK